MANDARHLATLLNRVRKDERRSSDHLPMSDLPRKPARFIGITRNDSDAIKRRWHTLADHDIHTPAVQATVDLDAVPDLKGNIENFIGFAQLPIGIAGPLHISGMYAQGDFLVPMATSEGALVASYHRGSRLITESGGANTVVIGEGVNRAPCFVFAGLKEATRFVAWMQQHSPEFHSVVKEHSRYCQLRDIRYDIFGKEVFVILDYFTDNAAGQNMVTIVTEAICRHLLTRCPIEPERWYLEGNHSGDKKATAQSFQSTRGKHVIAEATLDAQLVKRFLSVEPQDMANYLHSATAGAMAAGQFGVQGHVANALAAVYIACGQDAACVSEGSVGMLRMEVTTEGDLYAALTMPNIAVGTVGGGTKLPTAHDCLKMLGCTGPDGARRLAEISAALSLAGELSLIGAIAAGAYGNAHARYGRKKEAPLPSIAIVETNTETVSNPV